MTLATDHTAQRPIRRSAFRRRIGRWFYIWKRRWQWWTGKTKWATQRYAPLEEEVTTHHTPLLRTLKQVDMYLQENKKTNLRLAAEKICGVLIQPGETFSFWYLVGRPAARKGYLEGLVLENGRIGKDIGGGLCQMGNLIYWMALHTPLTVTERWRHSYDVFPDENRRLPFGSGATLAYNYIDLQLRNDTLQTYQLFVWLTDTDLHGAFYSPAPSPYRYEVFESQHFIRHEPWGGYSRHNAIARRVYDVASGTLLREEPVTQNHALMMYEPFLEGG